MRFPRFARGRAAVLLSALATVAVLVADPPTPAPADPTEPVGGSSSADSEGGSASLQTTLERASRGYIEARHKLVASKKRQAVLNRQVQELQKRAAVLATGAAAVAIEAYTGGQLLAATAALDSESIDVYLEKMTALDHLSWQDHQTIQALRKAQAAVGAQKKKVDAEVKLQQVQERTMAKRLSDAERALFAVGGNVTDGYGRSTMRAARSAPRGPGGLWLREPCVVNDPTTSGCLTPRTFHALLEARAVGFTRYTRCFRQASFGEHGKGRACDFAASAGGFGGAATGGDRIYGNRLASWFVDNADRLGVLYVIWYRKIWFPGLGWRSYFGGGGAAAAHTNHVHLSMQ